MKGPVNGNRKIGIERREAANIMEKEKILDTEYSKVFDRLRQDAMAMSYYKYGTVRDNYGTYRCMKPLENLELRLAKYRETGNTEFLVDIANFAMIEFMYPSLPGASYRPTDSGACEIAGFSVNGLKNG